MGKMLRLLVLIVIVPLGLMMFLLYRGGLLNAWVEVQPADAHFRARFPSQPVESATSVAHWRSLKAKEGAVEYGIGWGVFPAETKLVASPQVFQKMEAAVAQECGGKLAEERAVHRPLRQGMLEGRYVKIDAGKGWAEGYLFMYTIPPGRVWQIMVSYPKDGPPPPADKFLNGFQVLDL